MFINKTEPKRLEAMSLRIYEAVAKAVSLLRSRGFGNDSLAVNISDFNKRLLQMYAHYRLQSFADITNPADPFYIYGIPLQPYPFDTEIFVFVRSLAVREVFCVSINFEKDTVRINKEHQSNNSAPDWFAFDPEPKDTKF